GGLSPPYLLEAWRTHQRCPITPKLAAPPTAMPPKAALNSRSRMFLTEPFRLLYAIGIQSRGVSGKACRRFPAAELSTTGERAFTDNKRGVRMGTNRRLLSAAAVTLLAVVVGSAAIAQLTDDERKCTDAAYKAARNVGNQEQKGNRTCVKDGSGNIDSCVSAESAKAADKRTKLVALDDAGGKCATTPAFGLNANLDGIADSVEKGTDNILRGAFGDPVDIGAAGDKCADSLAKRSGKAYD